MKPLTVPPKNEKAQNLLISTVFGVQGVLTIAGVQDVHAHAHVHPPPARNSSRVRAGGGNKPAFGFLSYACGLVLCMWACVWAGFWAAFPLHARAQCPNQCSERPVFYLAHGAPACDVGAEAALRLIPGR